MTQINTGRVVIGGVVAGVILFIVGGIVNGAILGSDWKAWAQTMGSLIHPPSGSTAMLIWLIVSLVNGITGVWIYAGIRPRYGAGPRTAVLAGILVWLVASLTPAFGQVALGVYYKHVLAAEAVGGFVGFLVAMLAGAAIYQEE